jgi:hypothetical protein
MSSYFESACGVTITAAARAKKEITSHGADWTEFVCQIGSFETYDAGSVLLWLGY